jgi:hypothetical protein
MAVPLPNLTLAAPSQSQSGGTFNTPFVVGSGSAGSIPTWVWITGILVAGIVALKTRKRG